jgi:hypothetical protein
MTVGLYQADAGDHHIFFTSFEINQEGISVAKSSESCSSSDILEGARKGK